MICSCQYCTCTLWIDRLRPYLEPDQRLALVVLIRRYSTCLPPDYAQFHVLDFQPHEQEIDSSNNDVLEMVLALAVFKLNVQTILNPNIHLDDTVCLRRHAIAVDPEILLTNNIRHAPRDGDADEIAQPDVDARVRLILLLDVLEQERERVRVLQLARGRELRLQRQELVVHAAVVEHLDRADELHLDASVLEALAVFRPDRDCAFDGFAVQVQWCFLASVLVQLDVYGWSLVRVFEDDVDVDRGGH